MLCGVLNLCSCWLHWAVSRWFKFTTKFENQAQIIFIDSTNDTPPLCCFLSVLIALELITTLALKIKSSFSQTIKSYRMPNQTPGDASCTSSLPPHTHHAALLPFPLEVLLPNDFIWSQMISSTICIRMVSKST